MEWYCFVCHDGMVLFRLSWLNGTVSSVMMEWHCFVCHDGMVLFRLSWLNHHDRRNSTIPSWQTKQYHSIMTDETVPFHHDRQNSTIPSWQTKQYHSIMTDMVLFRLSWLNGTVSSVMMEWYCFVCHDGMVLFRLSWWNGTVSSVMIEWYCFVCHDGMVLFRLSWWNGTVSSVMMEDRRNSTIPSWQTKQYH
jgi:ribosomal protein L39E